MNPFANDSQEWTELARYLSGELSAAERARFEQEEDPAVLSQARKIWQAAGAENQHFDGGAALDAIKRRAAALPALPFQSPPRREPLIRYSTAAAIALISLGAGWFFTRRSQPVVAPEPQTPAMAEITTLPGQRADLLLPDGSRVTLGMASRLRYPVRYAGNSRDLFLDGEAYFQVVRDSAMPFRVHTRRGVTKDLGTAFDVRSFGGGPLNVVVAEGAVVLRAMHPADDDIRQPPVTDSLVLGTAELGRIDRHGKLTHLRDVDVDSYLAWREDRLVFRDTPLTEVLERLHAWYGIEIELGDPALGPRTFNATFEGEPANRVLDVLAVTVGLRYQRRGTLTLVYPATHPSSATP